METDLFALDTPLYKWLEQCNAFTMIWWHGAIPVMGWQPLDFLTLSSTFLCRLSSMEAIEWIANVYGVCSKKE